MFVTLRPQFAVLAGDANELGHPSHGAVLVEYLDDSIKDEYDIKE